MTEAESHLRGWVVESTGSWYRVMVDGAEMKATVRGKLRLDETSTTNPVAVGDRVLLFENEDGTAVIQSVLPRENRLTRRAAGRRVGQEHIIVSNVDIVWAVSSVKMPRFNPGFIDRVMVMASDSGIPGGVIINKIDLLIRDHDILEYWVDVYSAAGYKVVLTSALTGAGIDDLRNELSGKVSVLTGPSGAGKSSLLNSLDPSLSRKTGDVSEKTRKGKHVTTHASIMAFSDGYVVDTPGIREFGIVGIKESELSHHFPEFIDYLDNCRFPNCTHDHEPDCAVVAAVNSGALASERWSSYLNILESIRSGDRDVGR